MPADVDCHHEPSEQSSEQTGTHWQTLDNSTSLFPEIYQSGSWTNLCWRAGYSIAPTKERGSDNKSPAGLMCMERPGPISPWALDITSQNDFQ